MYAAGMSGISKLFEWWGLVDSGRNQHGGLMFASSLLHRQPPTNKVTCLGHVHVRSHGGLSRAYAKQIMKVTDQNAKDGC
jgi:hypothetical protein